MRKLLLMAIIALTGFSATALAGNPAMFFISLTDKPDTAYSLARPEAYLSRRAIDRRTRLGIAIDSTDLPVCRAYIDSIAATGADILAVSRWMNGVMAYATDAQLASILNLGFVRETELIRPANTLFRTPSKWKRSKGVKRAATANDSQNAQIGADRLRAAGYRGQGMLVAVIDAGFPQVNTHVGFTNLRNRSGIVDTYDFKNRTTDVYDQHWHGTCVLSTMAFDIDDEFVGSAPDADYCLYITEVDGEEYAYEADLYTVALERADSVGADVATASLGYFETDDSRADFTHANMDGQHFRSSRAATMAARKGMMVLVAAGNEGASNWHFIDTPADADCILTIGGVDEYGVRSYFSSYGPTADGRIKPELAARATGAIVANTENAGGSNITYSNGTSFATPIMAGMVASLMGAVPEANPAEVRAALKATASQASNPDNSLGWGIPNAEQAYIRLTGHGLGDAVYNTPAEEPIRAAIIGNTLIIEDYEGPYSLTDLTGKTLFTATYPNNNSVPTLSAGLYILRAGRQCLLISGQR